MDVELVIRKMNASDKIAQLCGIQMSKLLDDKGQFSLDLCRKNIPDGVGFVCQYGSGCNLLPNELSKTVAQIQNYLISETSSGVPAIFMEEAIDGVAIRGACITPQMLGMSCSWNPELIYENASESAVSLKKSGGSMVLSPVVDLACDPGWGRTEEGFGSDAYLTAALSKAFSEGMHDNGVAVTAKHFAGYGVADQSESYIRNNTLFPYETLISECDVEAVMPGYHMWHDEPCVASSELLGEILRKQMLFKGLVISDFGAVKNAAGCNSGVVGRIDAAKRCIKAGTDVDLPDGACFSLLPELIENDQEIALMINDSVKRVLCLKNSLHMFDNGIVVNITDEINLDSDEYREQAYKSALQSIIMLDNKGILPFDFRGKKIAVTGPNADSRYSLMGDYTWMGITEYFRGEPADKEHPFLSTLLGAIKEYASLNNCKVSYERGCDWGWHDNYMPEYEKGDERAETRKHKPLERIDETDESKAIQLAKNNDVVIAAMGENRFICGEGCDCKTINLPGEQEAFLNKLCDTGTPVILIIFGGRPMSISRIAQRCSAVLYAWYPGEEGGRAVVDLLSGRQNPSAKLTVALPDKPNEYELTISKRVLKCNTPYPFGYGLSYSRFTYLSLDIPEAVSLQEECFKITFQIKNDSDCDGTEITQIYMTEPECAEKRLIGFCRNDITKHDIIRCELTVFMDALAKYGEDGELGIISGKRLIQVAGSFTDKGLCSEVNFTGQTKLITERKHRFNVFRPVCEM